MAQYNFIWDDSDEGNILHLDEHGVSPEEAAYVVEFPDERDTSRSSGLPVAFGSTGDRYLMVVYEEVAPDTIYVHTAYEVPRKRKR